MVFIRWRLLDGGGVVVKEEMSIRHLVAPISVDPSIRSLCRHVQTRANWLEWKGGVSSSLIDFNGVILRGQSLVQAPIRRTLSFSTLGRMSPLRVLMSRVDSELELSLLQFLHADADLVAMADGLVLHRQGRLCLFGPSGSGKSAFARWVAQRMDVPLQVRRASDLMSKWVGGSEKNIARTFRQVDHPRGYRLVRRL